MDPGHGPPARLLGTRWVHLFEEDSAEGEVYRPERAVDLPLARRPRERFELRANGEAILTAGGPDDRLQERTGTWTREGDMFRIQAPDGETWQLTPVGDTLVRVVRTREG